MELVYEGASLSVAEAFKLLGTDLEKYLIYKKLALQGFKVKANEGESEPPLKIAKISQCGSTQDTLNKLQELGPQTFKLGRHNEADYVITSTKGQAQDFNIIFE